MMRHSPFQILMLVFLAAAGQNPLRAEVHNVQVEDNHYSPNDLTVQAGDTVRWTLTATADPGGGGCEYYCPPSEETEHTVTADDGTFSSGSPSSDFVFEHVFEGEGEYYYHCEVHSEAGRDIEQYMNGVVRVEGAPQEGFQINAGLNDAWFQPATAGQGLFITVFPDISRIFLAWFTYETERPPEDLVAVVGEPGHRWLTAFGPYEGDTAMLDIELTSGGVFDSPAPEPMSTQDGSIILQFSGCNAGTLVYDVSSSNVQGEFAIQRIATDNVALCEAAITR